MLPNLLTGQQTQGKVLAEVQKVSCNESEDNKERIPIVFIDPGVLVLYQSAVNCFVTVVHFICYPCVHCNVIRQPR